MRPPSAGWAEPGCERYCEGLPEPCRAACARAAPRPAGTRRPRAGAPGTHPGRLRRVLGPGPSRHGRTAARGRRPADRGGSATRSAVPAYPRTAACRTSAPRHDRCARLRAPAPHRGPALLTDPRPAQVSRFDARSTAPSCPWIRTPSCAPCCARRPGAVRRPSRTSAPSRSNGHPRNATGDPGPAGTEATGPAGREGGTDSRAGPRDRSRNGPRGGPAVAHLGPSSPAVTRPHPRRQPIRPLCTAFSGAVLARHGCARNALTGRLSV